MLRQQALGLVIAGSSLLGPSACEDDTLRVTPTSGATRGGDDVRIEGVGFGGHGPPLVHFGTTVAKAVVLESDRLIRVKTPPVDAEERVTVTLSFPDGEQREIAGAFEFEERDTVVELTPK